MSPESLQGQHVRPTGRAPTGGGRLIEIDRLMAAARANRSRRTEAELVVLRREAVAELGAAGWQPPAPAPADDAFAGITGLPEVARRDLDAHTVASGLLHHGALFVRGLVDPEQVELLQENRRDTEAIVRAMASAAADPNHEPGAGGDDEELAAATAATRLHCTPRTLFDLIEIYRSTGYGDIMEDYLGERPVLLAERTWLRRDDGGVGLPWHQDAAFFGGPPRGGVNTWLALSRCGDDRPGLSVIPRRLDRVHGHQADGPADLTYGRSITPELIAELAADHPVANPVFEPGDALLFDEMTMHRTSPQPWSAPRDVVITWFFAPSRFPEGLTPLVF